MKTLTNCIPLFSSPKRAKATATKKGDWFSYYASYSAPFVRDAITHVATNSAARVLDPWNGSGTTTTVAQELGINSIGLDINPVMVVVARAKLLTLGVGDSVLPLAAEIVAKAKQSSNTKVDNSDPLLEWFTPASAAPIRSMAQAISTLLISCDATGSVYRSATIGRVSNLAAFFLVALFRTTRSFVARFRPTNPTWIKSPTSEKHRVRPPNETLFQAFRLNVLEMATGLVAESRSATATVSLASSEKIPLDRAGANVVISSPPYCTRIDYAVATKPELAVLGCMVEDDFKSLRRRMIGGPVVGAASAPPQHTWGDRCLQFLKRVEGHPSKGSKNYYYKLFVQYFSGIHSSLREIDRVLVPGGQCILVAQDSYYKDVYVDVAGHISDMAQSLGWVVKSRFDFEASLVMARLNPKVQKYRTAMGATESVLWFQTTS